MSRPRVTASHETEPRWTQPMCGTRATTPRVLVEVDFDLHDHANALADLEFAVARVREQIAETTP